MKVSVGEDLGDGAASLVGWLAPKDSKLEKACAKFVKKNWSHDVFNFYYKSDFAKQSYMKEDGKVANCFKIAGTCVGYLYAGGAAAGLARGAAAGVTKAAAKGAVKNVSKLAAKTSKIRGFASSTTKANTATMGIGGLGHGTEEGMLEGDSINKAFRTKGLKEGAIGAALGLGGGKLGEVLSKRATLKAANNELKIAKESKASLVESGEKNVSKIEEATKRVETAEKNVKNISETKASSYEGYTDSITKAGQKFGKTIKGTSKSGAEALSKTVKASKLVRKGDIRANQAVDEASKAKAAFKQNAKELVKNNPVTDAAKGSKSVAKGTVKTVKEVPKKVVNKTSKFKEAAAKRRVATKTSSATKPSTSANKQTYKVNSKPKQVVKINNVNKTAPKAAKQTVATTSKRPSVMETIRSGKAALKETAAASKAIRNGSMESHALSASAAKKGEVFKDNLRGLFGRGSNNSVAEAAVESMSVGPTAGLAASGVGKASGLRGFFARGANKVDDFTKTMDDIGESATKGSSKVRSSDDVIDKFTKEDDELFKKLEEAKPTKEKPVEGKTGEQNSYKMTSEEKAKYDKLEAENLEHKKNIDYHQKEIDRIESKSPDGKHSSEEWDELTKHRMKMDDHKKALESNERHMDELDPSRMSEEQIDRELYALRDKRYELELDKNFADDVIKETNDKVRNGESFENLPESEKTTYNYWSNKRSGMDERISKLDERIDKLESVKNNGTDKADDAVQSVQKAREEFEVKPRASARTKTRTEDIINKADKADDASKASGRTKNQVRSEMDRVADTLAKREKSLDDAEKELSIYRKKNNIDPKDPKRVISEEEQTLINKAKNAKDDYLTQRTKLINKQKQYVEAAKEDAGKVGSEIKRTSKPKVIESKDGLKITDALAKVEGQIDGSALKSIPKEKINLIEYKAKIKNDIAKRIRSS